MSFLTSNISVEAGGFGLVEGLGLGMEIDRDEYLQRKTDLEK